MAKRVFVTTAYVEAEVDVHLDDIPEEDMINYLKSLGYLIDKNLDDKIWKLYILYTSEHGAGPEMDKALNEFFSEYYNKVSV